MYMYLSWVCIVDCLSWLIEAICCGLFKVNSNSGQSRQETAKSEPIFALYHIYIYIYVSIYLSICLSVCLFVLIDLFIY